MASLLWEASIVNDRNCLLTLCIGHVGTGLLLDGASSFLAAEYGVSVDVLLEADGMFFNGTMVTATAFLTYSALWKVGKIGIVARYKVTAVKLAQLRSFGMV